MSSTEGGGAKPKKSKKMLLVIIGMVVALVGGGAGGYFLFAPSSEKKEEPKPGIVAPLDAVTINLADGHYLKLGIALQVAEGTEEAPDGSHALDIAIELFSNLEIAELASDEERKRLKKELLEKIEKAYKKAEIEIIDVYFTQFVMQ